MANPKPTITLKTGVAGHASILANGRRIGDIVQTHTGWRIRWEMSGFRLLFATKPPAVGRTSHKTRKAAYAAARKALAALKPANTLVARVGVRGEMSSVPIRKPKDAKAAKSLAQQLLGDWWEQHGGDSYDNVMLNEFHVKIPGYGKFFASLCATK